MPNKRPNVEITMRRRASSSADDLIDPHLSHCYLQFSCMLSGFEDESYSPYMHLNTIIIEMKQLLILVISLVVGECIASVYAQTVFHND